MLNFCQFVCKKQLAWSLVEMSWDINPKPSVLLYHWQFLLFGQKQKKEVKWMMTKKRRVSQIKSIQATHPAPCPVVSKNGGELVQRWPSSKFLCINQTRKKDFVSSFSIFSWILVIRRPQPSGWLEGGDKSRRHDESSFWYAGLKICWKNCVTFKLEFMWIVDQAKESDPEHSVKVSGLAYIALVALHRSDASPTPS